MIWRDFIMLSENDMKEMLKIEDMMKLEHDAAIGCLKEMEGKAIVVNMFEPKSRVTYIDNLKVVDDKGYITLKDAKSRKAFKLRDLVIGSECYGMLGASIELVNGTFMRVDLA
jgi:hypothetical protein